MLGDLLHGEETRVWGDSAYAGQKEVTRETSPIAKDFTQKKAYRNRPLSEQDESANRYKSKVRARVEHIFGVMKRQFGYNKLRYRGLDKNAHSVFTNYADTGGANQFGDREASTNGHLGRITTPEIW